MRPRVGSLFAGYGGLDLAVEGVFGGELAWYSEIDKGALKILEHRFPGIANVGDVTAVDWSRVEPVEILTGGSPCQDLSHAGRRAGMTEGTRSNLWVAMREAIAQLRPRLVIWENVRGAYSAAADSAVEPCPGCVGDGPGVHLRALGRVLGDLSELGYDAQWHGLRAADVGAAHGRFRVFVIATDTNSKGRGSFGRLDTFGRDSDGRRGADGSWPATESEALLPTPVVGDAERSSLTYDRGNPTLVGALLPTPAVNDMGEGKTVERWDEWTADMQAKHANGNGHGKSLAIEAQRLLPTPTSADSGASGGSTPSDVTLTDAVVRTELGTKENPRHGAPEERPREELRDLRDSAPAEAVRERPTGRQERVPQEEVLLPVLREHQASGPGEHPPLAGASSEAADGVRDMRDDQEAARASHRSGRHEQRPGEPGGAVRFVSPEASLARRRAYSFGPYEAAVQRWESVLGREAPEPTSLSAKGTPQLSARFTEFLMGLPAGWVTDVPGITRNEALKALGNGVVPQQATEALRIMLDRLQAAA